LGQNTYWSWSDVFSERLHNELPDEVVSHCLSEVTFVEDLVDVLHGDLSEAFDLPVVDHQLHGGSQLYLPAFLEFLLVVGILLLERCVPGFSLVEGGIDLFILFKHRCLYLEGLTYLVKCFLSEGFFTGCKLVDLTF
jgi:hypothetical protein